MERILAPINTYSKLVLAFLFVVVPFFMLSLKINEFGSNNVNREITLSMQSKIRFYNELMGDDFGRIINWMKAFSSHDELDLLSNQAEILSANEKRETILKVQKELEILQSTSQFVKNVSVHISSLGRTISSINLFGDIPEDEFHVLNTPTNLFEAPFVYWNGRLFISLSFPIMVNNTSPEFVLGVEISIDKLTGMFDQFAINPHGGTLLVDNKRQWTIANKPHTVLLEPMIRDIVEKEGETHGIRQMKWNGQSYMVSFAVSQALGTTLVTYEPEEEVFGSAHRFREWLWVLIGLAVIVIALVSFFLYRVIHKPMNQLVRAFRRVERGDMNISVIYNHHDEFHYLFAQFNNMVRRLQEMIVEVYEQKYRAQHAEIKQLQSQINPHFFYNSLFILYRLSKKTGDEVLIRFSKYLGDYFEFVTRNTRTEVSLREEVQHALNYVEIQSIRFAHQIKVDFDELPIDFQAIQIPRIVLQPIIENAYKYALEEKEDEGRLAVRFDAEPDGLMISVEDNGEGMNETRAQELNNRLLNSPDPMEETSGMINVHRRLKYRYGEKYGLSLSVGELGGLKVSIQIPRGDDHVSDSHRGQ